MSDVVWTKLRNPKQNYTAEKQPTYCYAMKSVFLLIFKRETGKLI